MTEYIDKTEAMRRFKPFGREIPKDIVVGVIASVKEDIVRCKDCIYWKTDHPTANGYHCCWRMHNIFPMKEDDYCSRGERSEE